MLKLFKISKSNLMLMAAIFLINIAISISVYSVKADAAPQYPYQAVKIVSDMPIANNNLNIINNASNSNIVSKEDSGDSWERWSLIPTTDGLYYKIINENTGLPLTVSKFDVKDNTACVIYDDMYKDAQLWQIIPDGDDEKDKDNYGNYLHYKIVSKTNTDLALTLDTYKYQVCIRSYTDQDNQHWKFISDGLEGFASYCKDDLKIKSKDKAATIGGLLGKTVEVNTVEDLYSQIGDDTPRTIVITTSLDTGKTVNEPKSIGSNKTIIGYYGVQLKDFMLTTAIDDTNGSKNIIIKNITFVNSYGNGKNTPINISNNSQNIWLDHNTITGNITSEKEHINDTSDPMYSACSSINIQGYADFITISNSKFSDHYNALSIGESKENMNEYKGYPHITLSSNYFQNNYEGCPSINYATIHFLNNYILNSNYGLQIGYGSSVYSEGNHFEFVTIPVYTGNSSNISFKDTGSITRNFESKTDYSDKSTYEVDSIKDISASAQLTTWFPDSNYMYRKFIVSSSNKDAKLYDTKRFCTTYSGAISSSDQLKYKSYDEFKDSTLKITKK